jgi:nucleoside-triphosphatase THEP1
MSRLVVLSDDIQKGKSTHLLNWVKNFPDFVGFITPRVNGNMVFYAIKERLWLPYQMDASHEETVKVGRYHLSEKAIKKASRLMLEFSDNPAGHFLIDEIGSLEINHHNGLEPAFSQLLKKTIGHTVNINSTVMVVVRKTLLQAFQEKYGAYPMTIFEDFLSSDLTPDAILKRFNSEDSPS